MLLSFENKNYRVVLMLTIFLFFLFASARYGVLDFFFFYKNRLHLKQTPPCQATLEKVGFHPKHHIYVYMRAHHQQRISMFWVLWLLCETCGASKFFRNFFAFSVSTALPAVLRPRLYVYTSMVYVSGIHVKCGHDGIRRGGRFWCVLWQFK